MAIGWLSVLTAVPWSDIIQALSEQNAQLIQRMEIIRRRSLWLAGATLLASLCGGVSLYMAMTPP